MRGIGWAPTAEGGKIIASWFVATSSSSPFSNTKKVHSHSSITEGLFSRRKVTRLCLRPRVRELRNEELGPPWGRRKPLKGQRNVPTAGDGNTRHRPRSFLLLGALPGSHPSPGRASYPVPGKRQERGEPLTFSSSDTRSSKSAILGCSGPARPWRERGWEESRVMESQRGASEGPARKRRPRERHVSYGRGDGWASAPKEIS